MDSSPPLEPSKSIYWPKVIVRSDPSRIEVEWADGQRTSHGAAELRGICPCAQCVSETTGIRIHDPASVPDDLSHVEVHMVGNYALSIRFSDGHGTGIFPFRMLREAGPAL